MHLRILNTEWYVNDVSISTATFRIKLSTLRLM